MNENIQIIDGKFYTNPPVPVEVPRSDVVAMLEEAQNAKTGSENNLANAEASRVSTIASLDATIAKHTDDVSTAQARIDAIQAMLDQVPE